MLARLHSATASTEVACAGDSARKLYICLYIPSLAPDAHPAIPGTQKHSRGATPGRLMPGATPSTQKDITVRMLFLKLTTVRELLRYKQLPRAHCNEAAPPLLTFWLNSM